MRRFLELILFTVGLASLAGCSSDYGVEFIFESAPPDDAVVNEREIRIHEGIAVGVAARPLEDGEVMDSETPIHLETEDPRVLGVSFALEDAALWDDDADADANWSFVLFGVKAGRTTVNVYIDGDRAGSIPVDVEPQ